MPEITVKSYNQQMETLKKLLAGVRLHKNDDGFPAAVSETWIEGMISALENSRQAYDMNVSQGKQLNAVYTNNFKGNGKNIGRVNTMLYGFFGKKNAVINDFGLKPFKSNKPGTKKPST
jgi:hypothetical protein